MASLLIDRQIAGAPAAFAGFGPVRLFDGRALARAELGEAEILLVRSVTRVDQALLAGSAIRFVGTATAGTDHVDVDYLLHAGIHFTAAPGCNARAVAEHVVCCLYDYAECAARPLEALTVGIVGYGHVGRALGRLLTSLGIAFVVSDPPLGGALEGVVSATLDELLACDVVSVHTPLTFSGAHPTHNLLDAAAIARLRAGGLLINAARGGVVAEDALRQRLAQPRPPLAALDCWVGEPCLDGALLAVAWRASPHIAGHSLEARVNATTLLHGALCDYLQTSPALPDLLASNPLRLNQGGGQSVAAMLRLTHSLARHTERMRVLAGLAEADRGQQFDLLRARHGLRREWSSFSVAPTGLDLDTVHRLHALGLRVGR